MVIVPDQLQTLITTELTPQEGTNHIEVPAELIDQDSVEPGKMYQIAILEPHSTHSSPSENADSGSNSTSEESVHTSQNPPVQEGDVQTVTIETLGDQGDGIARVERDYVIIVPNTTPNEEVTIEIHTVQSNVAFATVINHDGGS